MSDSGMSLDCSIQDNCDESLDESDFEKSLEPINIQVKHSKHSVSPKLVKSQVTMSNINLSAQHQSPHLSRTSSTLSLATSSYRSSSPVTVMDVRTLTNNFQKMLAQATQEIKKLNIQKTKLEKEQEKLLIVNIELATEAKRLVKDVKEGKQEKEGLLAANDEFAEEVKRLYREEELWEEETLKLKTDTANISERLGQELKRVEEDLAQEKIKYKLQKEKLLESVRVLSLDNDRLLQEKEKEILNSSKSHTELKDAYNEQILKLEATIACLKSEIESECIIKEEVDKHSEELADELDKVEHEMDESRDNNITKLNQMQEKYSGQLKLLEKKSEKLAAENFEYAVENEELDKKLKINIESMKRFDKEFTQLKVENQWLVSNNKKGTWSEEKVEDMARELQELKIALRNEKEKVKNLADWKTQLADKNKMLKEENNRLFKKTEELEHVMNEEVTDISEMLKTINNLQDGKQSTDIRNMKRYM